jgi:hypothetical protein
MLIFYKPKKDNIVKYTAFCGDRKGDCAGCVKKLCWMCQKIVLDVSKNSVIVFDD